MPLDLHRAETFMGKFTVRNRQTNRPVPFRLNPSQQKIMQQCRDHVAKRRRLFVIFLKARRLGVSTWSRLLMTAHLMEKEHSDGLILAQQKITARALYEDFHSTAKQLPLHPDAWKYTQQEINFWGVPSKVSYQTAGNVVGTRGLGFTILHASEAAFYENPDVFPAVLSTLSDDPENMGVIETTPNGKEGPGQAYYELWEASVRGDTEYLPIFLPWHDDPDYVRPAHLAKDAPRDDYEKFLMKELKLPRERIAFYRQTLHSKCGGSLDKWRRDYPGCLLPDTYISTEEGIIPIAQARVGHETESGRVTACGYTGRKRCYELRTETGRILRGTWHHPLELADGKFVSIEESVGKMLKLRPPRFADNTFVVRWKDQCNAKTSIRVDADFALFLGFFMGDGSYSDGVVSVVCTRKDQDVVAEVERLLRKLFGEAHRRLAGAPTFGAEEVRVNSVYFARVMKELGIYRPNTKPHRLVCVPECIMRSPKPIVREFLRGLFESDGFNGYASNRVGLFSKRPDFLRQVQLLLLGFGITSRLSERDAVNGAGRDYRANELTLRGVESMVFNDVIGFVGERKRTRHPARKPIDGRFKPLYMLDTVESITDIGEHDVYDVSIEEEHVFSANGISSHNSPEEAFSVSGDPVFNFDDLNECKKTSDETEFKLVELEMSQGRERVVRLVDARDGRIAMFERPRHGAHYFLGVVIGRGDREDTDSANWEDTLAVVLFNGETGAIAARIHTQLREESATRLVYMLGRYYNNAMIACADDDGGFGSRIFQELRDRWRYHNQYRWKGRNDKANQHATPQSLGFTINDYTRRMMLTTFRTSLRRGEVKVLDHAFAGQMSAAQWEGGFRHESIAQFDEILYAGLVGWVAKDQWHPVQCSEYQSTQDGGVWDEAIARIAHQKSPFSTESGILTMRLQTPAERMRRRNSDAD